LPSMLDCSLVNGAMRLTSWDPDSVGRKTTTLLGMNLRWMASSISVVSLRRESPATTSSYYGPTAKSTATISWA